jgi:type IV pilus assembly protein PilA
MKFCPQCGQAGGDDQKFCMKCGADISAAVMGPGPYYPPPQSSKSNKTAHIIGAAIVVVMAIPVMLIVAAIAIPNLIRARMSANEASAVASVRTLNAALTAYQVSYNHYPETLAQLGPPAGSEAPSEQHAGLIDGVLASRVKSGYAFTYEVAPKQDANGSDGYTIHADPAQYDRTGVSHYFSDQSGVIRVDKAKEADDESPPLQ